jgi:uncharacterized protein DUF5681
VRGKKTGNLSDGESTPQKHRRTEGLRRPWESGQSGNPAGRPKGSRNKLSEQFFEELCADWQKGGAKAIERTRQEQPAIYLRVVASLMPKEFKVENDLSNMTDEQIVQRIRELDAAIAAELAGRPIAATPETDGETGPSRTKH